MESSNIGFSSLFYIDAKTEIFLGHKMQEKKIVSYLPHHPAFEKKL